MVEEILKKGRENAKIQFGVLTLFPQLFTSFLNESLIKRARELDLLEIELLNFREYGRGKHLQVDDLPYGGGAGMLLRVEPIYEALQTIKKNYPSQQTHSVLLSPQGKVFNQRKAKELSQKKNPIVLICGRYEGFDERVSSLVDEEISLGDFVSLGGEIPAMLTIDFPYNALIKCSILGDWFE